MFAIKAGHVCDMSASESKLRLRLRLRGLASDVLPRHSFATGPEPYCLGPRRRRRSALYLLARLTS